MGGSPKIQRHHLFPRKYLEQLGVVDLRQVNQIANLTPLEWHDNLAISADDPSAYWPAYLEAMRRPPPGIAGFSEPEIARMIKLHGLPENWPELRYDDFLTERRRRMAAVIREAFERLRHGDAATVADPTWPPSAAVIEHLLAEGETNQVEMKSSLRADTAGRGVPPNVLEKVVARTVAGFLNHSGGILIIGANDNGQPLGLDSDLQILQRKDLDGFQQTLVQVLTNYLGVDVVAAVRIHLGAVGAEGRTVAVVECEAHPHPVFLQDGQAKEFYVRVGNTTRLLDVEEATSYISNHWRSATSH
jgi:hypothetical protein